jgi:hypothetical protein
LDHEIVMANALPNPIPEDATVSLLLMVGESYVKSCFRVKDRHSNQRATAVLLIT